jgi:Cof subfamily protein (haloacid dehalogenase superfamily)
MKLLAFDVDDTLIGDDKLFKQTTIDSLNARLAKGDVVAIVSGRPYIGIMRFLSQLGEGKKYPIGANGAAVYDIEGHPLLVEGLEYQDYLSFYLAHQDLVKMGAEIYCYTLQDVAYFEAAKFISFETKWNGITGLDLRVHPLAPHTPILKFMIAWENADWSRLSLSEEEKEKYHIIRSDPRFLEFTSPKADKASGVEFLRQYLHIEAKDVYCFGDQGNDVEMIASYQGVAMANAIPEAKKVAKFVTLSANGDGVSYALKHFVK